MYMGINAYIYIYLAFHLYSRGTVISPVPAPDNQEHYKLNLICFKCIQLSRSWYDKTQSVT